MNHPSAEAEACALCPRLCRHVCPVASRGAVEAATPTAIAGAIVDHARGLLAPAVLGEALDLCVDCGACATFCHLGRPFPDIVRAARGALTAVHPTSVLPPLVSDGELLAIEADERSWSAALSARIGARVHTLRTDDGLGYAAIGQGAWLAHVRETFRVVRGRVVVADGRSARTLGAAGVSFEWLHQVLGVPVQPGCSADPSSASTCCGGIGDLAHRRPEIASRLARRAPSAPVWGDAVCARHLTSSGCSTGDAVDHLLSGGPP